MNKSFFFSVRSFRLVVTIAAILMTTTQLKAQTASYQDAGLGWPFTYTVDLIEAKPGYLHIRGWAFKNNENVNIKMIFTDHNGGQTIDLYSRQDVNNAYSLPNWINTGFDVYLPFHSGSYSGDQIICHTYAKNDQEVLTPYRIFYVTATIAKPTATFDMQGGTGGTSSTLVDYNTANPTITIPVKKGYTFAGYFTGTNGTGTKYYNGNGNSAANWKEVGSKTLYAQWVPNDYTVTFNRQDDSSNTDLKVTFGATTNNSVTPPTREGYTFDGWYTEATNGTLVYDNTGNCVVGDYWNSDKQWCYDKNLTLYAQWTKTIPAGITLNNGDKLNITSNSVIVKESGKNGIVIASGATATIHIAKGMTLTVYGGDGDGITAGKAGILLPSGSTLNVTGKGTLIVYGGNAGNGANGGKGYAVYHGQNYNKEAVVHFTSYPGSGGNGGGGAGAGIGTDGSNGANGQSVGTHCYHDFWTDHNEYQTYYHKSCLTQAIQNSVDAASCGTLNISTNTKSELYGGTAGKSGAKGEQGGCAVDGGSSYTVCDVRCGAGGAGGGGGAGSAGAGYGKGGRGGHGGSCGICGQHMRCSRGYDGGNSAYQGSTKLQGVQGITGSVYESGTSSTAGTINPVIIGGKVVKDFSNVAITDGQDLIINEEETVENISYTRTMTNDWGTICLPFALESNQNVQYYKLAEVDDQTMTFEPIESVAANTPAVFRRLSKDNYSASAGETTLSAEIQSGLSETADWKLIGTFTTQVLDHTDPNVYYIAQNKFWQATQGAKDLNFPAYRAYFRHESQGVKSSFFNIAIAGDPTTIGRLDTQTGEVTIIADGKYMENGNVIIIKNGKKFNVKGQEIK